MSTFACSNYRPVLSRRDAIKVGGLGLPGFAMPDLLRAGTLPNKLKARVKSVIFHFQWGGPSHLDMLDETLVVCMGASGRTPASNKNVSRDHWPFCYTILLYAQGPSDPVRPDDIEATIFAALGIDPHIEVTNADGRLAFLSDGNPITGVFV